MKKPAVAAGLVKLFRTFICYDVSDIQSGGDTNAVADGYLLVNFSREGDEKPRTPKAAKTKQVKQPIKLDPKLFQIQAAEKQAAISAEQQFSQLIQTDPGVAQAWRQIPADERADAQEDVIDLLAKGGTSDQVTDRLSGWLTESQLRHIQKMIKY